MTKKIISFIMSLILMMSVLIFSASAEQMDTGVSVSAKAAIVSEITTGQVLYEKNSGKRMNPIGISNILVLLTAVNNAPDLNALVEIKQDVLDVAVENTVGVLEDGEKYRLEDLLYLIILKNDSAAGAVVADYVGGSQEAFVEQMNALAQSYGMTNSLFSNAIGEYGLADDNYTDCLDTVKLMTEAIYNRNVANILSSQSHEMAAEGKDKFTINTVCPIMQTDNSNYYEDIYCGFADYDKKTSGCMVSSTEKDGLKLVCVMFNGNENKNFAATKSLYEWAYSLDRHVCVKRGDVLEKVDVTQSYTKLKCVSLTDVTYLCDDSFDENKLTVEHTIEEKLIAPIKKNDKIGIINVRYDGVLVGTISLVAGNDVEISMGEKITTPPLMLRLALLGFVVIVILVVFLIYRKRWLKVKN